MAENIYDEIEIEDMTYDSTLQIYHYPCPCGDRFEIAIADLRDGEEIAVCPSCSLMIRVVFEVDNLPKEEEETISTSAEAQVPVAAWAWRRYKRTIVITFEKEKGSKKPDIGSKKKIEMQRKSCAGWAG
jgi:diphthamide biosynthesis protein 3